MSNDQNFTDQIEAAIRGTMKEFCETYSKADITGFALATDCEMSSLYNVITTKEWQRSVDEEEKFAFPEWEIEADTDLFEEISDEFANQCDNTMEDEKAAIEGQRERFLATVNALKKCRENGVFEESTYLAVGSSDPAEYMELMGSWAVGSLNTPDIYNRYRDVFGVPEVAKMPNSPEA